MLQHSKLSLGPALYSQRCLKNAILLVVCSGTLGSTDWFQQCPQCCCLALLSWAIVSFAVCSLAEEKTCKINTAGELPREARLAADLAWQPCTQVPSCRVCSLMLCLHFIGWRICFGRRLPKKIWSTNLCERISW